MTPQEFLDQRPSVPPQAGTSVEARQLDSRTLMGSEREILINHNGELYRLRLTRAGKLILTK